MRETHLVLITPKSRWPLATSVKLSMRKANTPRQRTSIERLSRSAAALWVRQHPEVATYLIWLSGTPRHTGKPAAAEAAAREALEINRTKLGAEHPRTAEAEGALGMALCAQRKWHEAEPHLIHYANALKGRPGVEGDLTQVTQEIVRMYVALGKPREAAEWRARLPK